MNDLGSAANLEGLLELAQSGAVDIKPRLLRMLTDLFVQRRITSMDAMRHYIMLTLKLLDCAPLDDRKAVAVQLASNPHAPRSIIERLARDEIEVAEHVLRYSPCLTPSALESIVAEKGLRYAAIIAQRRHTGPIPDAMPTPPAPATVFSGATNGAELTEQFFAAAPAKRRQLLQELELSRTPAPIDISDAAAFEAIRRVEAAALTHSPDGFARELERALNISFTLARRILADASGEPMVACAKALRCPREVLHRILLFLNPSVGQSVERVYALASLFDEISETAARRLIAAWREAEPRAQAAPAYNGMFWDDRALDPRATQAAPRPLSAPLGALPRRIDQRRA